MSFKINVGLDHRGVRLEPGEVFDGDLPGWVVEQGYATPVEKPKKKTSRKAYDR